MILRKVKGFVENIVGPVRVDSRLIMRKFEGHFQKIPEREELDSGCIFIKFYKIFFCIKWPGKVLLNHLPGRSDERELLARWPPSVGEFSPIGCPGFILLRWFYMENFCMFINKTKRGANHTQPFDSTKGHMVLSSRAQSIEHWILNPSVLSYISSGFRCYWAVKSRAQINFFTCS